MGRIYKSTDLIGEFSFKDEGDSLKANFIKDLSILIYLIGIHLI